MSKVRLGDIAEVITKGTTPTSLGYEFEDSGINFIKIESITESGGFINDKFAHISSECHYALKRSQLKTNDILFSIAGAIGRVGIVDDSILPANTNQALAIIRIPDGIVDYNYLFFYLHSNNISKQYNRKKQGVAQINLSLKDISDFEIELPSVYEQIRIAKKIDKVNSLLINTKKRLSKLDELIKSRFVEMFGDLADPKCNWEKFSLTNLCNKKGDIKCGPFGTQLSKDEYTDSGIALWEIPQINSAFSLPPTHFIKKEKAKKLQDYSLIAGDIAMSRKGNVGRCAIFPDGYEDGIIHSDVLRIRLNKEKVNPVFIMCQLHFSGYVTKQIELVSLGAIMAGINVTKLKNILLHVPPITLQNRFADFVTHVEKQKATVQQSIDKLETLKKSLMQEYFG